MVVQYGRSRHPLLGTALQVGYDKPCHTSRALCWFAIQQVDPVFTRQAPRVWLTSKARWVHVLLTPLSVGHPNSLQGTRIRSCQPCSHALPMLATNTTSPPGWNICVLSTLFVVCICSGNTEGPLLPRPVRWAWSSGSSAQRPSQANALPRRGVEHGYE